MDINYEILQHIHFNLQFFLSTNFTIMILAYVYLLVCASLLLNGSIKVCVLRKASL